MAIISQYQVVIPGQLITAALWNAMELNIINNGLIPAGIEDYSTNDAQAQTQTDPYPASTLSKATDLAGEVARLRYQLAQVTGQTYWYIDADFSIYTLKNSALTLAGVKTFSSAPILSSLTATTVPYLDGSKQFASSAVNPTELGYLSGVTSAIQAQLGTKATTAGALTASRPVKTDGSSLLTATQINLASTNDVTGVLGAPNGGSGLAGKFITVVSYTGNGSARSISHGLGAAPGFVMIIQTNNGTQAPEVWITGFSANVSRETNGNINANGITSVDATNVNIGNSGVVNSNTLPYTMICVVGQ